MRTLIVLYFLLVLGVSSGFSVGETEFSPGNTDAKTRSIRREVYSRHVSTYRQPDIDLPTGGITKGRIAIECDGNVFASDDLGAIPLGIGILWKQNRVEKIVHVGYNNNPNPDRWANTAKEQSDLHQHEEFEHIVNKTVQLFGLSDAIVYNYARHAEIEKATDHLAQAVNASGANNPLYIVEAGAMIYLYQALAKADDTKHPFVTVVTHSGWNDIECYDAKLNANIVDILRDFPKVRFDYIVDQNRGHLRLGGETGWNAIAWMKSSDDPKTQWLYTCAQKGDPHRWGFFNLGTEVDVSDAGMFYYLVTGDMDSNFQKLKALMTTE